MKKKEILKQRAERLFAKTNHKELYGVVSVTEFFTTARKAKSACGKNEEPIKFVPSDFDKPKVKQLNAKDTIAAIEAAETLEALAEFDKEAETRKTVLEALAQKKEALSKDTGSDKDPGTDEEE